MQTIFYRIHNNQIAKRILTSICCATAIKFENKITHFTNKKSNPNNETHYSQIESAKTIFQGK